ncbi:protein of unknown function [Nitratireductor aquimarinus]
MNRFHLSGSQAGAGITLFFMYYFTESRSVFI